MAVAVVPFLQVGGGRSKLSFLPFFPASKPNSRIRHFIRQGLTIQGQVFETIKSRQRGVGTVVKCERSSAANAQSDDKIPFGYTRKDVILIGIGLIVFGVGLKYGLEFIGVDSLRAGNVVQIVMVLGLTIGWISTYIFRVSNKEMTYAKQLEDYEKKVMEKRLDELPEAELESLLAQVEEEKRRLKERQNRKNQF